MHVHSRSTENEEQREYACAFLGQNINKDRQRMKNKENMQADSSVEQI